MNIMAKRENKGSHFTPYQGCSRCGAPSFKQQPQRKVPGWFYASSTLAQLSELPAVNPEAKEDFEENVDYHNQRVGKVQDWLTRCKKRSNNHRSELEYRMFSLMTGARNSRETNRRISDWIDSSMTASTSFLPKTDIESQIGGGKKALKSKNTCFSRYLSNDGDLFTKHIQRRVGPIQRPHTPNKDLFEKQKSRFGEHLKMNAAKKSSFVDFTHMRDRTNALHSELKTILMD